MHVIEAIKKRRSIKHFDPTHQLTDKEIYALLSTTMLSPTAFNIQNWRFVIIRDPVLRAKIRAHSWNQSQITDASLLVALCADLNAWNINPARYWSHAPEVVRDLIIPSIELYYEDHPTIIRDEAMRSCGLAAQTLMLTATSMGFESCPMVGFDFNEVGRLIDLPEEHIISMMVAIGKSVQEPWPQGGKISYEEAVRENSFSGITITTEWKEDFVDFRTGVYRHYKGEHYLVLGLAREDISDETVVVYSRLYHREGLPLSTRTLKAWNQQVAVDGNLVPRFSYVGHMSS
ncbi:DUF1653 domain-containing protein [Enterobacter mori]|uniref:DUF1653 domain-containing protein n=1 Tax=Enterobacter mori TaxID=539813 RepID=UPI001B8BE982|nr:DUF1653 domain-containing protein [Enterobacter mori]MBS3049730.1 DUF1653 domain-containing protein [Enterobacter mori]